MLYGSSTTHDGGEGPSRSILCGRDGRAIFRGLLALLLGMFLAACGGDSGVGGGAAGGGGDGGAGGGGGGTGGGGGGTQPPVDPSIVVIEGRVIDAPIPFAEVSFTVSGQEFSAQADENGNYVISINGDDPQAIVLAEATDPDNPALRFFSLIGSLGRLVEEAGDDGTLVRAENNQVNITNITTAQFVLLLEANGGNIESEDELVSALQRISVERMIELAAIIKLVIDDGAPLPDGVTDVFELISSEEAVEVFKAESVTPEQLAQAIEDLTNPELNPDLVARYTPELVPEQYFLVLGSNPGTIRVGSSNAWLARFDSDGSGEFFDASFNDNPAMSWSIDGETGVLTILRENPPVVEVFAFCGGAGTPVRLTFRTPRYDLTLISGGPVIDLVKLTSYVEREYPDGIPEGCDLPGDTSGSAFYTFYKSGAGIAGYTVEELSGQQIMLSRFLGSEPGSFGFGQVTLDQLNADGTGSRRPWAPFGPEAAEPVDIAPVDISWSVDSGLLVIEETISGDRYVYQRLKSDGQGGEGVYVVRERGIARQADFRLSTLVDPTLSLTNPDFLAEWFTGFGLGVPEGDPLWMEDPGPWLRLCNDIEPTPENTGPLFGTGFQGISPASWGLLEDGSVQILRYRRDSEGPVTYCDVDAEPGCSLVVARSWLPVRQSAGIRGDRLYVLEELFSNVSGTSSSRPNFYERGACTP